MFHIRLLRKDTLSILSLLDLGVALTFFCLKQALSWYSTPLERFQNESSDAVIGVECRFMQRPRGYGTLLVKPLLSL